MGNKDTSSLAHTTYECKYHIVFTPKYRRQVIYGQIRADIGKILRQLCEYKGVEIIEAEACKDHIHMLVSIPPKYSVSQIMGYLKGKSSIMIFDCHANLKYKYGNRKFWCTGYFGSTVAMVSVTASRETPVRANHVSRSDESSSFSMRLFLSQPVAARYSSH